VHVYHRKVLPHTAGHSHGTEEADWGSAAEVILHFFPCKGQMEAPFQMEGPCPSENDASV
jgi:hypothetical protein